MHDHEWRTCLTMDYHGSMREKRQRYTMVRHGQLCLG